ncbi:hypothetical protein ABB37_04666 [Leptomonas pyrrhocoris]|uniref:C2H2-type domain-containing protein n=1 Tax=Leptomonas pyrrhocoris TaxID=157538 RepID=A0A0M9G1P0_LEPPY|nr:hypothetical protein ABB37_04666 [Leptomonas pyrrhocoris]XP_015658873.1 hypothetical protein ABB37_04666 [Leptomonas pyrrhocoris]KPA80433.1 hypothetical protein ABB37_04666 [Leptomonas pyrrhocoris]KPA80434.1 hypothetical protein ABB37_04666 [Leptomonas pyrrhocoris]|eukprot:XP_015658872.1 hypothetical protein ABB37_04666 [Leptomonas pyrrhocoris]
MPPVKNPVFFVIGSTGTGKSKVAVHLAQELKGSYGYQNVAIVNCDVYQCFDALPISTNKPSAEQLGNVPHAFLGFLEADGTLCASRAYPSPTEAAAHAAASSALKQEKIFNVHTYEKMVTSFISEYFQQHDGAALIVCGGTCYYVQALLFSNSLVHDVDATAPDDTKEGRDGVENAWERLHEIDADTASRYHPNDSRRIKRMLDIHKNTGQKPSIIFEEHETQLRFDCCSVFVIWTHMERPHLDSALNQRVDEMLHRGMIDEVRGFWAAFKGNPPHSSLTEAIGCKEFLRLLAEHNSSQVNEAELKTAVEQVKANTRRYARQQERWIKNRLIRLLQTTALKEQWTHFVVFPTDQGNGALLNISTLLQTFFIAPCDNVAGDLEYPLKEEVRTQAPVCQEKCAICGLLVYGRGQMEAHLKSKRHRGALRRLALEKEQREVYGRKLPPPKRKRGF